MFHNLTTFQQIVRAQGFAPLNLRRYKKVKANYGLSDGDIAGLLLALQAQDFDKSKQDCAINEDPNRTVINADQYVIHWDLNTNRRAGAAPHCLEICLKIAIAQDADGNYAGLVTIKPSGTDY